MKTQFMITEMSVLQNGKIALAGSVVGSLLVVGQRGSATTASVVLQNDASGFAGRNAHRHFEPES